MSKAGHNAEPGQLRRLVDRLVNLEEQKRDIATDIKDVKAEAASAGFDKRVVTQMVKEALMDSDQRAAQREFEEICEVYRANLGMLGGTPLGEAARKRAAGLPAELEDDKTEADESADSEGEREPADGLDGTMSTDDIDAAREKGREAGRTGVKIFANPYLFSDPRRAAWDEGHCEASGSDGMEIPESWRRRSKKAHRGDEGRAP